MKARFPWGSSSRRPPSARVGAAARWPGCRFPAGRRRTCRGSAALCVATAGDAVLNVTELKTGSPRPGERHRGRGGQTSPWTRRSPGQGPASHPRRPAYQNKARLAVGPVAGLALVANDGGSGGCVPVVPGPQRRGDLVGLGARLTNQWERLQAGQYGGAPPPPSGSIRRDTVPWPTAYDAGVAGFTPAPPVTPTFPDPGGLSNHLSILSIDDDGGWGPGRPDPTQYAPRAWCKTFRLAGVDCQSRQERDRRRPHRLEFWPVAGRFGGRRSWSKRARLVMRPSLASWGLVGVNDGVAPGCLASGTRHRQGPIRVGSAVQRELNNGVVSATPRSQGRRRKGERFAGRRTGWRRLRDRSATL